MQWGRDHGACLDKIEYPAAFGPRGELLGIAVVQDIKAGETIMSVPCSIRIDYNTIMADPDISQAIKALGPRIESDEELVMALYFMRQRVLGTASPVYHSLQTATPPDLAMSWKPEEINFLQDRTTIESVLLMRKTLDETFEHLYTQFVAHPELLPLFFPKEIIPQDGQ